MRQNVHHTNLVALVTANCLYGVLKIRNGVGVALLANHNVGLCGVKRRHHLFRHFAHVAGYGVQKVLRLVVFFHFGVAPRQPDVGFGLGVLVVVLTDNGCELLNGGVIVLLYRQRLAVPHLSIVNPLHVFVFVHERLLLIRQFFPFFLVRLDSYGVFAYAFLTFLDYTVHVAVRCQRGFFVAIHKHGQNKREVFVVCRVDVLHARLERLVAIEIDIVFRCGVMIGAPQRSVFGRRTANQHGSRSRRAHTQNDSAEIRHKRFLISLWCKNSFLGVL